jgi:putative spermidine/putrescine transport system substrate-binding protein
MTSPIRRGMTRFVSRRLLGTLTVTLLLAASACGDGGDSANSGASGKGRVGGTLAYATWGGEYTKTLRQHMLEPFAKEVGVRIETPSAPGEFVPKLQAQANAGQVEWSLLDPGEVEAQVLIQQGLLAKLPADVKAFLVEKVGEQNVTDYGVSMGVYSDVIACNPDLVERCPTTPAEFWDVDNFPGRRAMYGDGWDINIIYALEADGVPRDGLFANTDIDRAFGKLDEIKPHVNVWWTSGDQSQQIFRDGEVAMAIMWDGRAYQLRDQGMKQLKISHDGMLRARELIVVPRDAPNPEAAFAFLRWYVTHPKQGAAWVKAIGYGVAAPKALAFLPKTVSQQIATAPENVAVTIPLDAEWDVKYQDEVLPRWTNWLAQ